MQDCHGQVDLANVRKILLPFIYTVYDIRWEKRFYWCASFNQPESAFEGSTTGLLPDFAKDVLINLWKEKDANQVHPNFTIKGNYILALESLLGCFPINFSTYRWLNRDISCTSVILESSTEHTVVMVERAHRCHSGCSLGMRMCLKPKFFTLSTSEWTEAYYW